MPKHKIVINLIETLTGHWYRVIPEPDMEILLPSSTTVLEYFPSPSLDFWKTNTSPEEIKEKQEAGKTQGSKVHHCIDVAIQGGTVDVNGLTEEQIKSIGLSDKKLVSYLQEPLTERESKALVGFENFWFDKLPVTEKNEIQVFNYKRGKDGVYNGYAGTLDWVGYLWDSKRKQYDLWILDWKTSKTPSKSNSLQVVSYHKALEFTYKKKINARLGVVYLGNTTKKKYTLSEIKDGKECWEMFKTTKLLWDFLNPNKKPDLTVLQEKYAINTSYDFTARKSLLTTNKNAKRTSKGLKSISPLRPMRKVSEQENIGSPLPSDEMGDQLPLLVPTPSEG
jgi:hypothetical protein